MKITIKTFASLRDAAGFDEKEIIVPEGITIDEVVRRLSVSFEGLAARKGSLLYAVNEEYARPDTVLAEGDILAMFPPVSGG
ncbi:MAG: MoaD/ThiS family protein [Spirochaetes bacterium]|nr:MAG: MoaD/ThiS family protein [Spirochaetota bacterium]